MKFFVTKAEIGKIKWYLTNDLRWKESMSTTQRKTFVVKAKNFILVNDEIMFSKDGIVKYIVADDDNEQLDIVLKDLHLPDHTGMKAMYENSKLKYVGVKRDKIDEFVSSCIECRRNQPLARIAPITLIISESPWSLVQVGCIDMRNFAEDNDGFGWILPLFLIWKVFRKIFRKIFLQLPLIQPQHILDKQQTTGFGHGQFRRVDLYE